MTPLDQAHEAMEAAPADEAAQLAFYARLAASELFVLLTAEPSGETISPEIFDVADARFVLVFDTEERLSSFAGRSVPYVALTGRAIAYMLAGQKTGIALNPDVAPSAMLLPPESMDWLADTLNTNLHETEARPEEIAPPAGVPEALFGALDRQLAAAEGLARMAYLVSVRYDTGAHGHLLGVIGARPGAETALARAVQEALSFSGLEAGALDVAFFDPSDAMAASLARHGLRFDLPQAPEPIVPAAPGSDPDRPPRLK